MKLWLDDQLHDMYTPERHTPNGYVGVSTALDACRLLKSKRVSHISFDHDLGKGTDDQGGYIVARFIEKGAAMGTISSLTWDIHSANPVGRKNIELAMKSAERFWATWTGD